MTQIATAPQKSILDKDLIVPFVNSVRSVFSTMIGIEMTVERPYLKTDHTTTYDVSGIIGFSGQIIGSVTLSFETAIAVKIVTAFAGSPIEATSPDFADAIGELANMVAGAAKKDFGSQASITVPTVILSKGHCAARLKEVACIVLPCVTAEGRFTLEVSIKRV